MYNMINYWNKQVDEKGYVYSVDMLRLNLVLDTEFKLLHYLENNQMYYDFDYYECNKPYAYRHIFVLKFALGDDVVTATLGQSFNGNKSKGFLEFNPNKLYNASGFKNFLDAISRYIKRSDVSRYDLAIDMPGSKECYKLIQDTRKYAYVRSKGAETEYLGCRNKPGFTKLYDKSAEAKLKADLTRLELTFGGYDDVTELPQVAVYSERLLLDDFYEDVSLLNTDRVLAEMLSKMDAGEAEYYLKKLGSRKRKKLTPYITRSVCKFDVECLRKCKGFALSH